MSKTQLFVYGTLRHDEPEHARFCRGGTGWQPARVRGRLVRIPEGYLLLVVPPSAILQRASVDAAADESQRATIADAAIKRAEAAATEDKWGWIDGELLTFADAAVAWPPLDEWEGCSPGRDTVYQRFVVPVRVGERAISAWGYVTTREL